MGCMGHPDDQSSSISQGNFDNKPAQPSPVGARAMPPRLEALQRLRTTQLCRLRPPVRHATPGFLPVMQTANLSLKEKKKLAKQDSYRWNQMQQRKNANLERQNELRKERTEAWGHPILGKTTPYVESFDSAGQDSLSAANNGYDGNYIEQPHALPTTPGLRNYFLDDNELQDAIKHGYAMTRPTIGSIELQMDPKTEDEIKKHDVNHKKAVIAIKRITSLQNASGKDRFHANVKRIINEFGRHKTDSILKPKPQSINPSEEVKVQRAGPDTGSSEVQIAILTLKIRALTKTLERPPRVGLHDKHNQRSLRLLVHKRQKLLRYMERKERGSERWTHLIDKLGLTPATWKGEITL